MLQWDYRMIRNGLRSRDPSSDFGPDKDPLYRFIRWSWLGVFNRIFKALQPVVVSQIG